MPGRSNAWGDGEAARPAPRSVLRLVAELYYVRDWSQAEIAELLRCSVSKVSRMLAAARADQIVQITVDSDPHELEPLARELSDALGAVATLTAGRRGDTPAAGAVCAVAAAPLVAAMLPELGVVGTAGGYTISTLANALPRVSRPGLTIVPLLGGLHLTSPPLLDINVMTDRIAERLGATPRRLLAPGLLDSPATKEALLRDTVVRATTDLWSKLACALLGVSGGPVDQPGYTTVFDQLSDDERARLASKGVAGDIAGHLFTIDGEPVEDEWASRLLCIDLDRLRACPQAILVAAGPHKVRSIVGACRTGAIDRLFTDELTAASILRLVESGRRDSLGAPSPVTAKGGR